MGHICKPLAFIVGRPKNIARNMNNYVTFKIHKMDL